MLYCHRSYTSIYSPVGGHTHSATDTIKVPVLVVVTDELSLDGPAAVPTTTLEDQPALLASGAWRINCTPACEQGIQKAVQYVAASEKAIPLTGEEVREAERESARSQVEVAQMARAMSTMLRAEAASHA